MLMTTMDLDRILSARNEAEKSILEVLSDVRMDDYPALLEALKQLESIQEVMHKVVTSY